MPARGAARFRRRWRCHARRGIRAVEASCPVRARGRCATAIRAAIRVRPRGAALGRGLAGRAASRPWLTGDAGCTGAVAPARGRRPGVPRWRRRIRSTVAMGPRLGAFLPRSMRCCAVRVSGVAWRGGGIRAAMSGRGRRGDGSHRRFSRADPSPQPPPSRGGGESSPGYDGEWAGCHQIATSRPNSTTVSAGRRK